MPAFAGMTLTFRSDPPILNDSRDWAGRSVAGRNIVVGKIAEERCEPVDDFAKRERLAIRDRYSAHGNEIQ
jgi:hypothetical protein